MGVQGFQEFLEKRCPGAVVPVDLLKLARTVSRQQQQQHLHRQLPPAALAPGAPRITRGSAPLPPPLPPAAFGAYSGGAGPTRHHHPAHHFHHHGQAPPGLHPPPPPPLPGARVLVDAGSALPRLYGGYQTDWVCGGQWNAMLGYLSALCQACAYPGGDGLELVVMFPGGLGKDRLAEWGRRCQAERQTAQLIVGHVGQKVIKDQPTHASQPLQPFRVMKRSLPAPKSSFCYQCYRTKLPAKHFLFILTCLSQYSVLTELLSKIEMPSSYRPSWTQAAQF